MRRFAWFDCLRCGAVFLVMLAHFGDCSKCPPSALLADFIWVQNFSWFGVDLFFVLSGFLVSGLLFDEHDKTGTLDIKRFLIRRAFKIIPAFYVLTLITMLHDAFFNHRVVWVHVVHDVLFLQSYRAGAWAHAWTLAIEVHFYILLALLMAWLSKTPPKSGRWLDRLPAIMIGVLIASLMARGLNSGWRHTPFNTHREFEPSHLHLDVLAAGVLLRYVYNYHQELLAIFQRRRPLWIGSALLLVYPSEFLWTHHSAVVTALIPTCNYLGFSLILFEATQFSFPTSGVARWFVLPFDYLGKHSYSIYLWHLPVKFWIVDALFPSLGNANLVFFYIAAPLVGTFFSVILEMPVLHLRNRLFPATTSSSKISRTVPSGVGTSRLPRAEG